VLSMMSVHVYERFKSESFFELNSYFSQKFVRSYVNEILCSSKSMLSSNFDRYSKSIMNITHSGVSLHSYDNLCQ